MKSSAWRGALLAAPAVLWTFAFFVLPSSAIALWSFFRREGGVLVTTPSLDNYRRLIADDTYALALQHSLETTLLVTALSVLLAYPLAYAIACRVAPRWQRAVLMLAVLPFWTSYVVRSYAWLLVLAPEGVVNRALMAWGWIAASASAILGELQRRASAPTLRRRSRELSFQSHVSHNSCSAGDSRDRRSH